MLNIESVDKRQPSLHRQASSRANGARSKGPVTPEGKAASSRNAVTHGCLAAHITLNPEDAAFFENIRRQYNLRFEPRDQIEHDLTEQIVYASFQMRQVWIQLTSLIGLQMANDSAEVDKRWHPLSEHDRRALAFAASIQASPAIAHLERYARSYASQAERAIKLLMDLKKQPLLPLRPVLCPTERNEPSSENGHPPEPAGDVTGSHPEPAAQACSLTPIAEQAHAAVRAVFAYPGGSPATRRIRIDQTCSASDDGALHVMTAGSSESRRF